MKKYLLLIFCFLFIGCASNKAINTELKQMKSNLEQAQAELTAAKSETVELKNIMIGIGDIANNMDGLLIKLKTGDAAARTYFNDVIVPYMRSQQIQIDELKKRLGEIE